MTPEGFYSLESLAGTHVLVVDDEPACRDLFSQILRYCGALVTVSGSVEDALRVMAITRCDVLIADVAMPHEAGYTLIRTIRALKPEEGGVMRAVAVTALGRPPDAEALRAAGFDAWLTKPVDPWALCRLVASLAMGSNEC